MGYAKKSWAAAIFITLLAPAMAGAAEITIIPGAGFDDDTPREPVGGNTGETIGEQREIAFSYAAAVLGSKLQSDVEIRVDAAFIPLDCSAQTAVLGQAGPQVSLRDFPGAPETEVFYPIALANALAGTDLVPPDDEAADPGPETDIGAEFNSDIDNDPTCLSTINWYYGLNGDPPPASIDFLSTVTHELIHGLGFFSGVDLTTGEFIANGFPFVYDTRIVDLNLGEWQELSDNERMASIVNEPLVVFDGSLTTSQAAQTRTDGVNDGRVQLFAPNDGPIPGSSISHWDTEVAPDALMEPRETNNININNGLGLSTCALADIGWQLAPGIECPDRQQVAPEDFGFGADAGTPSNGDNGDGTADGDDDANSDDDGATGDPGDGDAATSGDGGGSGGGCTLAGPANQAAPLLPLLIVGALLGLCRRRFGPAAPETATH